MTARETTQRDHQRRIDRVLAFIQDNPDKPLRLATLAEIACLSPHHFHRVFAAHVGETLRDHVRRVRLEKAALALHYSQATVSEVGFIHGYKTAAAFSKAFREHFGVNPSSFRSKLVSIPHRAHSKSKKAASRDNMKLPPA